MGVEARILEDKIDIGRVIEEMISEAYRRGGGALSIFIGFVKGRVEGHDVEELVYEAYMPYAENILRKIVAEESVREGIIDARVYHRIGAIKAGEPTVYVLVTATNRKTAIETTAKIIERIKHEIPIFKLEIRDDGEYWIIGDGKRIKRTIKTKDNHC